MKGLLMDNVEVKHVTAGITGDAILGAMAPLAAGEAVFGLENMQTKVLPQVRKQLNTWLDYMAGEITQEEMETIIGN